MSKNRVFGTNREQKALFITIKFITHEETSCLRMKFGKLKPYLWSALIIPACFIIIFLISWLLGLGEPDWEMNFLKNIFLSSGTEMPPIPDGAWLVLFIVTLVFAPFLNSVFGLGEEIGWRGLSVSQAPVS